MYVDCKCCKFFFFNQEEVIPMMEFHVSNNIMLENIKG